MNPFYMVLCVGIVIDTSRARPVPYPICFASGSVDGRAERCHHGRWEWCISTRVWRYVACSIRLNQ